MLINLLLQYFHCHWMVGVGCGGPHTFYQSVCMYISATAIDRRCEFQYGRPYLNNKKHYMVSLACITCAKTVPH